ncbi:2-amino-4-hydroxy-6-hydroxymethyldihydropteridine diphosphokinase [Flavobacterium sp.]|uniref:2-amino-4-hydroxy-6- hydroxymethyldihydropteridine diphosphokinase n=1 Tax=Flavobacterium sp. TaxID=239 RepID=UPI003B999322
MIHTAYIGIGSNEGDSFEIIEQAVREIHEQIGSVVGISPIYMSAAVGFSGPEFLNAVIKVHTFYEPLQILRCLLSLEAEYGRVRDASGGYRSRTLDLDVLLFNDQHINVPELIVPHPRMHERLFVLLPLSDVYDAQQIPGINESINQLISKCREQQIHKTAKQIHLPVQKLVKEHLRYLVVEGNIGAGKSSLSARLAADYNGKQVLERFADNPFLPKFYDDPQRYAFPLEMSFLADRYRQLMEDLLQVDLFSDFIVADYYILKSVIFANVNLNEDEFRLYKTLFDIMYKEIPKPDLYVYLYRSTESLLQNIKKRGREYEQNIEASYLEKINAGYVAFLKSESQMRVLVIDVSELDFVENQRDYLQIVDQIADAIAQ